MEIDTTIFAQGALIAFGLVFLGGIVTSSGPCNVARIPLLVGYVGGTPTRGRAFTLFTPPCESGLEEMVIDMPAIG